MMELSVQTSLNVQVNLAAAVQLRNFVEWNWRFRTMKEAKELLEPEELKQIKIVIVKEDEWNLIWSKILDAIS